MRRRGPWILFAVGLAAVAGVMFWVTTTMLAFERAQQEATHQAAVEDQVRLALWRIDSSMGPRLSREIAEVAYAASAPTAAPPKPAWVRARFVLEGDAVRWLGDDTSETAPDLGEISVDVLAERLENPQANTLALNDLPQQAPDDGYFSASAQAYRSTAEWNKRAATANDNALNQQLSNALPDISTIELQTSLGLPPTAPDDVVASVRAGSFAPLWVNDDLVAARIVRDGDATAMVQGSVVDWPRLQRVLAQEIGDLLPNASFEPALVPSGDDAGRLLATLPVRLHPGELAQLPVEGWSPLRASLVIGWAVVLVGTGAVFGLLVWSWSLSERRAAFVSAVTHELRTPLTTFRMYTEMLSEGMVEDKRDRYVATLRKEADRLGNLVENVLSFAKIERRKSSASTRTKLRVDEFVERIEQRLDRRCVEAGLRLEVESPDDVAQMTIELDPAAAEQVLFNLVDNAAKYAPSDEDGRVLLSTAVGRRAVEFRVRDFGPGISPDERRKIFEPFAKGRAHEAGTQPGVGLGLALCRRLAKSMGGTLELEDATPGCAFVLTLPRGRS